MTYLDKSAIQLLDAEIDSVIPTFPLLALPRARALIVILLTFELTIEVLEKTNQNRRNGYRNAYNGLNFAMEWIHRYCPNGSDNKLITNFTQEELDDGFALIDAAADYAVIWSQMTMLFRGRLRAERLGARSIRLTPATLKRAEVDIARTMVVNAADPELPEMSLDLLPVTRQYLRNKLSVRLSPLTGLKYAVAPSVFANVRHAVRERSLLSWSMNSTWDLGGYSLQEFRALSYTIQSCRAIHRTAIDTIRNHKTRLSVRLMIKNRIQWISELSAKSALSRQTVAAILDDLVYDESLFVSGRPRGHVMYHPFFKVENGSLAMSNAIVQISNAERNIWSLLGLLRPKIHDDLKNHKELHWVHEIRKELEGFGLICIPNIKFEHEGKPRNIDLLVLDENRQFGLVCELKWLTPTDDAKGVFYSDQELEKGADQASISKKWVDQNRSELARQTDFPLHQLRNVEFKPIVISKESLLSGFAGSPSAPVINSSLLKWILEKPHTHSIDTLWQIADRKSYLPKAGVHFEFDSHELEWNGLRFHMDGCGFKINPDNKRWRPEVDIGTELHTDE